MQEPRTKTNDHPTRPSQWVITTILVLGQHKETRVGPTQNYLDWVGTTLGLGQRSTFDNALGSGHRSKNDTRLVKTCRLATRSDFACVKMLNPILPATNRGPTVRNPSWPVSRAHQPLSQCCPSWLKGEPRGFLRQWANISNARIWIAKFAGVTLKNKHPEENVNMNSVNMAECKSQRFPPNTASHLVAPNARETLGLAQNSIKQSLCTQTPHLQPHWSSNSIGQLQ